MISYEPLFDTLKQRNMNISQLRSEMHPSVIAKINAGVPITLPKIEDICVALQVPIENVVRIDYAKSK